MWNMLAFIPHITLTVSFVIGIYMLPILIQPPQPTATEIQALATSSQFKAELVRDLPDSNFLHWGESEVSINTNSISLQGKLGYLPTVYVNDQASFNANRRHVVALGSVPLSARLNTN